MFKRLIYVVVIAVSFIPGVYLVRAMYEGNVTNNISNVIEKEVDRNTPTVFINTSNSDYSTVLSKDIGPTDMLAVNKINTAPKHNKSLGIVENKSKKIPVVNAGSVGKNKIQQSLTDETIKEPQVTEFLSPLILPLIYSDNLQSGWFINASPSTIVNLKSTRTYGGLFAIKTTFENGNSAIEFSNKRGVDAKVFDGVYFFIAGRDGGEKITLSLYNRNEEKLGSQEISRYLSLGKITQNYAPVYIKFNPLSAQKSLIFKISLTSHSASEIYIDDFSFVKNPLYKPTSGLGDTQSSDVFEDELKNGWEIYNQSSDTRIYYKDGVKNTASIQTTFRESGQQFILQQDQGMHTNSYNILLLWVRGKALEREIYMQFKTTEGILLRKITLNDYVRNSSFYTDFQRLEIPLIDLEARNKTIHDIVFTSKEASGELDLDEIKFD